MGRRTHYTALVLATVFVMVGPLLTGQITADAKAARPTTYNLYFGDLHSHTSYSDAWEGTPWDAFKAAKDGGADFFATTDHAPSWNAYSGLALDPEEWADTLAAADYYTSSDFVAMAGYETWMLGRLGEVNVYNSRELPPAEPLGYKFDRLPELYDWLASIGAQGQFNHPTYMTNNFEDYAYLTKSRDSAMNMIEVYNDVITEDSYIMALDKGWHVLPTVNSDTHNTDWISGYEMRTVLLADSLTPANLYGAMSACRGYGTMDSNLRISYTLNGAVMGLTLSAKTSSYTAKISISDPDGTPEDEITMVEIVSDGGVVVASAKTSGTAVDLSLSFSSATSHYYYLRVYTASPLDGSPGITAWTSPVWTGR